MIIGRNGEGATKLKEDILKKMDKLGIPKPEDFKLEIVEITNPEADAAVLLIWSPKAWRRECLIAESSNKLLKR